MSWSLWTPWRFIGAVEVWLRSIFQVCAASGQHHALSTLPSAEDLTGCHSAGHCLAPPPSARFPLRPLGITPRIAQSVTQTLYLLSYTVSFLILHDTCLKADLACCSNNCCCRWWLPSSGVWRRTVWYNFPPFRRNLLLPSGDPKMEAEVPPSRLSDVTDSVHSTTVRTSIVAWCCRPFRRIVKWTGQARPGHLHMDSASELHCNERKKYNLANPVQTTWHRFAVQRSTLLLGF
jgi:hypothetical protein